VRLELRHSIGPVAIGSTPILIGEGSWRQAAAEFAPWLDGRTLFVVTTPRVWSLHGAAVAPLLAAAGRPVVCEVAEGERAKRLDVCDRLWRDMVRAGGRRSSRLLAFGGGSVGDLGGVVAACFLRGIEWAQGPTTLLAQVDASIGGKTAVDLAEGKNTVGRLHHPRFVATDPSLLTTLDGAEFRAGLVEAIKVAFVASGERFAWIERHADAILAREATAVAALVETSVALKAAIVERDPEDQADRLALNFGHTLGHAIEAALDYGTLRHGEAVAYGMLFALRLSLRRGLAPEAAGRLRALLERLAPPPLPRLEPETLLAILERDKKAASDGPRWVLSSRLGAHRAGERVEAAEARRELEAFLRGPWDFSA
jgi:3-dehydroquinate synthase